MRGARAATSGHDPQAGQATVAPESYLFLADDPADTAALAGLLPGSAVKTFDAILSADDDEAELWACARYVVALVPGDGGLALLARARDATRRLGDSAESIEIHSWEGWKAGTPCRPPAPVVSAGILVSWILMLPALPAAPSAAPLPAEPKGDDEPPIPVPSWPDPPEAPAFSGLAGEIIRAIEPYTESDTVAILAQLLIGFGNAIGRSAHFQVEADRHYTNEFAALVGDTAKGRKGTSWGHVRRLLDQIDPAWAAGRILGGLSTGEGLIHAVRDPVMKREPVRDKGRITGYQEIEADAGESDKRLLAIEPELGGTLRIATRDGNTLSALVRQAWDSGDLGTLTRNNPLRATGAHISTIGHITRDELARLLTRTEAANGFANRILWLAVRRSKLLPFGGCPDPATIADLTRRLGDAAAFARLTGRMARDADADALWADAYERLSDGRPGLLGAVTSRAEPHTMRLAMLYALLDRSPIIRAEHLRAGLALWGYAERSARFIFGDALGDPDADALLDALRAAGPKGLTRTEIREGVFQKHKSAERIAGMLRTLAAAGLAHARTEATAGRPAERWIAGREPAP